MVALELYPVAARAPHPNVLVQAKDFGYVESEMELWKVVPCFRHVQAMVIWAVGFEHVPAMDVYVVVGFWHVEAMETVVGF